MVCLPLKAGKMYIIYSKIPHLHVDLRHYDAVETRFLDFR